jgi:hypothetical protein
MPPLKEQKNSKKRTIHRHLPEGFFRVIGRLSAAYFKLIALCFVIRIRKSEFSAP